MAKTKNTPRKRPICPSCKETVPSDENFETHLVKCANSRKQCDMCPKSFKREAYLRRHVKLIHSAASSGATGTDLNLPSTSRTETVQDEHNERHSVESLDSSEVESTDESSWDQDPKVDILEEKTNSDDQGGSLILGRLVRKPTHPAPVNAGAKRKVPELSSVDIQENSGKRMCGTKVQHAEKGVQVNPEVEARSTQVETPRGSCNRCEVCGITFDNMAMMFIHKGCHTTGNEMKCNVCGQECQDNMSFFIHVTMGHRQ